MTVLAAMATNKNVESARAVSEAIIMLRLNLMSFYLQGASGRGRGRGGGE
jgi:hypothetical protein